MRVITGKAKGKRLKTLEGMDTRPTTDRVKEGLFNIIQFDIPESRVLDLFAGSGQIGIEALSRGAKYAVFNDESRQSQQIIKENLINTDLFKYSRVISMDAKSYLDITKDVFDIVFLDPPYNSGILQVILPIVASKMSDRGIIVCEHEKNEQLPEKVLNFNLKKQYKYGKIAVSIYRIIEEDGGL